MDGKKYKNKVFEGYSWKKKEIGELKEKMHQRGISSTLVVDQLIVEPVGATSYRAEISANYAVIYSINDTRPGNENTGVDEALLKFLAKEYPHKRK
jgi:hypothetical protein